MNHSSSRGLKNSRLLPIAGEPSAFLGIFGEPDRKEPAFVLNSLYISLYFSLSVFIRNDRMK